MFVANGVSLRFNQNIYIITYNLLDEYAYGRAKKEVSGIIKDKLLFVGEKSFITKGVYVAHDTYRYLTEGAYKYDDFETIWFTSLKDAKKYVLSKRNTCKLVKINSWYWRLT